MKRRLMYCLAAIFPWIILLMNDNPGGAFVALAMQVTVILWPVSAIWAINVVSENYKNDAKQ